MFTFNKVKRARNETHDATEKNKKEKKMFYFSHTQVDRTPILNLLPQHELSMTEILNVCKFSERTMKAYNETKDELTLLFYYLMMFKMNNSCSDESTLVRNANELTAAVWDALSSFDRYVFIASMHSVLCEWPSTPETSFISSIQFICNAHFVPTLRLFVIPDIHERDTFELLIAYALKTNDVPAITFFSTIMPIDYFTTLVATVNNSLKDCISYSNLENGYFYAFNEKVCSDEMFAFLLTFSGRGHDIDMLCELASHDFACWASLTRLRQASAMTNMSIPRIKSWKAKCNSNQWNKFMRSCTENVTTFFLSNTGTCSIFLRFFHDIIGLKYFVPLYGVPLLLIIMQYHVSSWQTIKSLVPEDELIDCMYDGTLLSQFYVDFPFHQKLLTTHLPLQKLRNHLIKNNLIQQYVEHNEVQGVQWAWALLTCARKQKFWEYCDNITNIMHVLLYKNNEMSTTMFAILYNDGFADKKKSIPYETTSILFTIRSRLRALRENPLSNLCLFQNKFNNTALHDASLFFFAFELLDSAYTNTFGNHYVQNILPFYLDNIDTFIQQNKKEILYMILMSCVSITPTTQLAINKQQVLTSFKKVMLHDEALMYSPIIITNNVSALNYNANSIMKYAIRNQHFDIMFLLLEIPAIASATEQANYYNINDALKPIVQDKESAMRELNSYERSIYDNVLARYGKNVDDLSTSNILTMMRERLREEFEASCTLPFTYDDSLEKIQYLTNKFHTAWRFLADTNPLVDKRSAYLTATHGSSYHGLARTFCAYYLAAIDDTQPCINDFASVRERELFFFNELAGMNRTHNWDTIHHAADGSSFEADDNGLDKPTCFSGMLRRIIVSVPGNAISCAIPTEQSIKEVKRDFLLPLFEKRKETLNEQTYNRVIIDLEPLTHETYNELHALNLTDAEQCSLFQTLLKKTFCTMKDIIALKKEMQPYPNDMRLGNLHVFTLFNFSQ